MEPGQQDHFIYQNLLRSYRFTKKTSNDMDSKVNRGKKEILPAPSDLGLTQK